MLGPALVVLTYLAGAGLATTAAIEDFRVRRLRDRYTAAMAVVAVVGFGLAAAVGGGGLPVTAMALGVLLFSGPWFALHVIAPSEMGFGDVKLTAALGLYLGWLDPRAALHATVIAVAVFLVGIAVTRSSSGERKPFGPALVFGAAAASVVAWLAA